MRGVTAHDDLAKAVITIHYWDKVGRLRDLGSLPVSHHDVIHGRTSSVKDRSRWVMLSQYGKYVLSLRLQRPPLQISVCFSLVLVYSFLGSFVLLFDPIFIGGPDYGRLGVPAIRSLTLPFIAHTNHQSLPQVHIIILSGT